MNGIDFSKKEKIVIFDFDDTLYAHTLYGKDNSCLINKAPMMELADRKFISRIIKELINNGVHIGVASFGKKSVIIQTLNNLLYDNKVPDDPYFSDNNVKTVPDLPDEWKESLNHISSTFKGLVAKHNTDVDLAFEDFLNSQNPTKNQKYFCLKLNPKAKVKMIDMIIEYYNKKNNTNITRSEVRFFDDDSDNVNAALAAGIMAHVVPKPGLTEKWWHNECQKLSACFY